MSLLLTEADKGSPQPYREYVRAVTALVAARLEGRIRSEATLTVELDAARAELGDAVAPKDPSAFCESLLTLVDAAVRGVRPLATLSADIDTLIGSL